MISDLGRGGPMKPPRSRFTVREDRLLLYLVNILCMRNWGKIAELMGTRNARQCRERWTNYVNPELRRGEWTEAEDRLLEEKRAEFGSKWNIISGFFDRRSDVSVRNRWQVIEMRNRNVDNPRRHDERVRCTVPNDEEDMRLGISAVFLGV
jgi:hypothetical protein